MHQIIYSIRQIASDALPRRRDPAKKRDRPASPEELLNIGIVHLVDDYYSCAEQLVSDDVLDVVRAAGVFGRVWHPLHEPHPGRIVTQGTVHERHAQLPADAKARILHAHVVRGATKRVNARAVIEKRVRSPRRALQRDAAAADERGRMIEAAHAALADKRARVTLQRVPMGDVDPARDFVLEENVIPHHWAGELLANR
jgi:hypothetical protein